MIARIYPNGSLMIFYREHFVPAMLDGKAKGTIDQYKWAINALCRCAACDVLIDDVTRSKLAEFQLWMRAQAFGANTEQLYLSLIRRVAGMARPERWPDPANAVWLQSQPGTLLNYVRNVYSLARVIEPNTGKQLQYAVCKFGKFLGKAATAEDLTSEHLNTFLRDIAKDYAPETVKSNRRAILTIWRALYEDGAIDQYPRRIRKLKPIRRMPEAWTVEHVEKLLATADAIQQKFRRNKLPMRLFWRALILIGWETGLRRGDCIRLPFNSIDEAGRFTVTQQKTGYPLIRELSPIAMQAIGKLTALGLNNLDGIITNRQLCRICRKLIERAGLKGTFKYLRRAGATAVELATPGAATQFLGHRSPGLAYAHYVDARQLQHNRPKPPQIGGAQ